MSIDVHVITSVKDSKRSKGMFYIRLRPVQPLDGHRCKPIIIPVDVSGVVLSGGLVRAKQACPCKVQEQHQKHHRISSSDIYVRRLGTSLRKVLHILHTRFPLALPDKRRCNKYRAQPAEPVPGRVTQCPASCGQAYYIYKPCSESKPH
jgi:hypothetical protein